MTIDDYERAAARTLNSQLNASNQLLDAAAGLAEEAGEVLGLVRKQVMQHRPFSAERLAEELGDALWCLTMVARSAGLSLDAIAAANIVKLVRRYPTGLMLPNA